MHRTNIYLEEQQTHELDRIAAHEGVSRAELIRRLIDQGLRSQDRTTETDLRHLDLAFGVDIEAEFDDRSPGDRDEHLQKMWQLRP